jgi:hypothetical protein
MGTNEGGAGAKGATEGAAPGLETQARIDKAIADAAKAAADAAKAAAEARSAAAKAASDELEAAWSSSPAGVAKRDAEARKAAAEADQAAVTAKRNEYTSLIPDFSKIERGSLDLKGDQPLFGTPLAQRALKEAAASVVDKAVKVLPREDKWRVLVTSDADLVTSHSTYVNTITTINQLCESIDTLLAKTTDRIYETMAAAPAIGAIAAALPGLISLFSAKRTVTTSIASGDDLAAAAATADQLLQVGTHGTVFHDDVRLLAPGRLHARLGSLREKRQLLAAERMEATAKKATAAAELAAGKKLVEDTRKKLADAATGEQPALSKVLEQAEATVCALEGSIETITLKLSLAESLQTSVDAFITSLTTIPEGAKRSPFEVAVWREGLRDVPLHDGEASGSPPNPEPDPPFTHVLLVKGNAGSVQQAVNDKPLWLKDRYCVVATASITHVLLRAKDGSILAAGIEDGLATGTGKVGDEFELHVKSGGTP